MITVYLFLKACTEIFCYGVIAAMNNLHLGLSEWFCVVLCSTDVDIMG